MERLKDAEIIDSVDFSRDFEDPDQWRSVRPLPLLLALVPVIGLVLFLLVRYRLLLMRLIHTLIRLRRMNGLIKRAGSVILRIVEAGLRE